MAPKKKTEKKQPMKVIDYWYAVSMTTVDNITKIKVVVYDTMAEAMANRRAAVVVVQREKLNETVLSLLPK